MIAIGPAGVREGVSWEDPFFSDVLDGLNSQLGYVVQRAHGREALHFADCAGGTAAAGIWSGSPAAG